jgi:putative FmdB family regulatory protein
MGTHHKTKGALPTRLFHSGDSRIRDPDLSKNARPHREEFVTDPMLNPPTEGSRILPSHLFKTVEVRMPHYEFFCRDCNKFFDKILSLVDYEEGEVQCPHCGSKNVEQRWSAFSAITSKKSA